MNRESLLRGRGTSINVKLYNTRFGLNIFISFKRTFGVTNIQLYNDTYINRRGFRRKLSDLF